MKSLETELFRVLVAAGAVLSAAAVCGGNLSSLDVRGALGSGEAQPLFNGGVSAWTVTVPENAARPLRYAAEEFTNAVFRISGARLGVTTAADAPKINVVRIEAPDLDTTADEFSVRSVPGEIVLKGNSPRAALFAVYAFLRDRLGARWYWPGESGEYLPRLESFKVAEWEKTYKPHFEQRALSICRVWRHRHADVERWLPRVFINCGINTPEIQEDVGAIRRMTGHYISLPENKTRRAEVFERHPEWFSLLGGKREFRGYAGCWSNAEFFRYVVSNSVQLIRSRRAQQANLFAADILPRCECAACTANPDVSARWWEFYARIIDAVRREIPGMSFTGLAYQEYRAIPGTPVRNVDHVEYCHYNRCYYHRLDDATCPRNVKSMAEFRRWGEKTPLGFYGYAFDAMSLKKPLYLPLWRMIADEMRVFSKMDMRRVKTEYQVDLHYLTRKKDPLPKSRILLLASRLSFYAWAMAAFDPDGDMEAVVEDFCRRVYGAGASDMKAYHDLMADAWGNMKSHLGYYFNSPRGPAMEMITPALIAAARSRLSAAKAKCAGDDRAASEVALDAECFENWVTEAEDGRRRAVVLTLPAPGETGAPKPLEAKARNGTPQKTRFTLVRGKEALALSAECAEEDMGSFSSGTVKNDDPNIWGSGSYLEMFIESADGSRHQLAVSPAGGVWDKRNGDLKWNSKAVSRLTKGKDFWKLEVSLPYSAFGEVPKSGDKWKFMVIRNVSADPGETPKFASCGWPVNAHGDWGSAATLKFE